jgi:type VI secretion system secreted protein Hcp
MATTAYLVLVDQRKMLVTGGSAPTPDFTNPFGPPTIKGVAGSVFEVDDYSVDIEQASTIGAQSAVAGAGAGKATFNPFSITRKIDKTSPLLFRMACSGQPFQTVDLLVSPSTGAVVLAYRFSLVAIRTIAWSHDDETPRETVTFEYGGLSISYATPKPDGTLEPAVATGWNRFTNTAITDVTAPLQVT